MPTTAEASGGRRLALVIATRTYSDPKLSRLRAPGQDAADLADVLEDPAIGGFEVESILDVPIHDLRTKIAGFFKKVGGKDFVLVYLSCHGVLDDRGRLYYAAGDTDSELLSASGLAAGWLNEQLEECGSRRLVLILDCCHSGAFAKGAKGGDALALPEHFQGRGRIVLTGSRAMEHSFEGGKIAGDGASSVFTGALVEGLRSGDADLDRDGIVTVKELYDHTYDLVRQREKRQTPMYWVFDAEGDMALARSPRGAIVEPAPLPEHLKVLVESPLPRARRSGVEGLGELLVESDAGRALTARQELKRIADEDVADVAAAARAELGKAPEGSAAGGDASPEQVRQAPGDPPRSPAGPKLRKRLPKARRRFGKKRQGWQAIGAAALLVALVVVALAIALNGGGSGGVKKIAVEGTPGGIAVGSDAAWVTRPEDDQVDKLDLSTGSISDTFDVSPQPGDIAAGEGMVWVSIGGDGTLTMIDTDTGKPGPQKAVKGAPCECLAEMKIADQKLWVSTGPPREMLEGFPLGSDEPAETYGDLGFEGAFDVADNTAWLVGIDKTNDEQDFPWWRRIDLASEIPGERKRPKEGLPPSGVAVGKEEVWIAVAEDDLVLPYDPESRAFGSPIEIPNGISGNDLVAVEGGALAWNAKTGWLSRIDYKSKAVTSERIDGYTTEEAKNVEEGQLAADNETAWVTDPAGEAVFRVPYRSLLAS
jgi:hypothetical protein